MRRTRPSWPLSLALLLCALFAASIQAGELQRGLGVYYAPVGPARSGELALGQRLLLSVRIESLTLPFADGISGVQFGLDVDPRLTVRNTYPTSDAFFPSQVAPGEWLIGLSQCKLAPLSQYIVMMLDVEIAPGTTDLADLRVGVRDLTQFGERMGFTHCLGNGHFSRLYDAGDVLLNPSSPSIVHFSAAPEVVVRGQLLQLGWDVHGADAVALDGSPVTSSGMSNSTPTIAQAHTLTASAGGTDVASELTVEVIEKPRVEFFTATVFETQPATRVQLKWEVTGASSVTTDALPGTEYEIGQGVLTVGDELTWTLRASNEWGSTVAVATIEGNWENLPPLIIDFTAEPVIFAPLQSIEVSWTILNAANADLSPAPGAIDPAGGTLQLNLRDDTELVLSAHNANGTVTRTIPLQLAALAIDEFRANPPEAYGGFPTQLEWQVRNAETVTIEPGIGLVDAQSGSVAVTPTQAGTVYTLTAANAQRSLSISRSIAWLPPAGHFSSAPQLVAPGVPFEVELFLEGALSARLLPFPGDIAPQSQTIELTLDQTTTLQLQFENLAAQGVVEHEVVVGPPRIQLSTTLPDNRPWSGVPFTLSVVIEAATEATLEPGFGSVSPSGGSFEITIEEATTFLCTASNSLGSTSESLLLVPSVLEAELTASPAIRYGGFPYWLTATITGAQQATLTPLGVISPSGGTFQIQAATNITHTLTATASGQTITRTLAVNPQKPHIQRFEVITPEVRVGEPFQIAVEIAGAKSASLSPPYLSLPAAGAVVTRTILIPTTFTLTATNPTGTTTAQLLVTPFGFAVDLKASTTTPFGGRPFTLTATLVDAESATLEPGFGNIDPAGGSFQASVAVPTTFTLTGRHGTVQISDAVAIVPRVPSLALTASNATPFPDETITLQATIDGADTASLDPGFGAIAPQSAGFNTQVPATTVFRLSAVNPTGSAQVTRTVTPKAPRFVSNPSFTPSSILFGETATLQWNADHFDQLQIDPIAYSTTSWGLNSVSVSPAITTTYSLRATNTAGTTTRTATLTVTPFRIQSFTASQTQIQPGQPVELRWIVFGDADVELLGIGPQPLIGSLVVTPTQTVQYTLRARNGSLVEQRTLTIYVGPNSGSGIYLSWNSQVIPGQGPPLTPFSFYEVWVVARGVIGGMTGFECTITVPPCESTLGAQILPSPSALNVGSGGSYMVGLGLCFLQTDFPMLRLLMLHTQNSCLIDPFTIGSTIPTSFGGVPGYSNCANELIPFQAGPPLYLYTDVTPLALELQLDARQDGNLLQWSLAGEIDGDELRIYRRVDDGSEQLVQTVPASADSWLDADIATGRSFAYELAAVVAGQEARSARKSVQRNLPPALATRSHLLPNVPNPFNPSTQLRFALAMSGDVTLTLHDLSGRLVWTQRLLGLSPGEHATTWTGIDEAGRAVASGVYLVRLDGPDGIDTRRIALLK